MTTGPGGRRLRAGLAEFGGCCDCEVVLNCGPEDVFG
ncbi:DUF2695 domain-containing protein [Dactylosporangium sp. CS-047395]